MGPARPDAYRSRVARLLESSAAIPASRTFAVVLESESPWWGPVLAHLPEENIVEQPIDRGSATGVLLAFLEIFKRDPSAEVVIATSLADPPALAAFAEARAALLLDRTDRALVCADDRGRVSLCVASSAALLRLYGESQPALLATLVDYVRGSATGMTSLDELYAFLPVVELSRDVFGVSPYDVSHLAAS